MFECIKFGDCKSKDNTKVKTRKDKSKDNTNGKFEWFAATRHIGIALGLSSDTLQGIVYYHLPQRYKFSGKEIAIDISYYGSKFLTAIPGA